MTPRQRVLAALRLDAQPASSLRFGRSVDAVRMDIKRLRDAGHEITFRPSGSPQVPGLYQLVRLAGDLRNLESQQHD